MIIGVALVVDDLNKGQKLVYRYPESIPSALFDLSNEALVKFHRDYLSFSPDNFAKLFRPKASYYNQVLDLVIDDLHYISFPCPCKFNKNAERSNQVSGIDNINLFNVVITKVRDSAMNKFTNLDGGSYSKEWCGDREEDGGRDWNYLLDPGVDPISVAMGLRERFQKEVSLESIKDVVQAFSLALLHLERNQGYVSRQVALMFDIVENGHRLKSQSVPSFSIPANSLFSGKNSSETGQKPHQQDGAGGDKMDTNVVESEESSPSIGSSGSGEEEAQNRPRPQAHRVQMDDETSGRKTMTGSMDRSHVSTRTVITVDRTILTADEVDQYQGGGGRTILSQAGAGGNDEYEYGTEDLEGLEVLLQHSTLANELRRLYHGLIGGHSVVLSVNSAIDLNIKLVSKAEGEQRRKAEIARDQRGDQNQGDEVEGEEQEEVEKERLSVLRECEVTTILPVGDADELSTILRGGRSTRSDFTGTSGINPRLISLLSSCNITRSVAELSAEQDMTVEEVYEMGCHLQAWGLAFFIPVLTKKSVLQVHSQACLDAGNQVAQAFNATFLRPLLEEEKDADADYDGTQAGANASTEANDSGGGADNDIFHSDLFRAVDSRPPYNLVCFMAIFDGRRTLSQAVQLVPAPLQEHTLDMAVWLLRRKLVYVRDPRMIREEQDVAALLKKKYPLTT